MRPLRDGFHGELHDELSGAEGDWSFVPTAAGGDRLPVPEVRGPTAVLIERGVLVLACRTRPDPDELTWAP